MKCIKEPYYLKINNCYNLNINGTDFITAVGLYFIVFIQVLFTSFNCAKGGVLVRHVVHQIKGLDRTCVES